MKALRRLGWALLSLLVLAALALAAYAWRSLPRIDGAQRLDGPAAALRIERDADGIPTVQAANLADLMFGLGYAHAQDRLWQMETHRRIASGRLAEAFGEAALPTDRFLRALGVRRAAAAQWARLDDASRQLLLAYTRGVNAWLHQGLRARPPEFVLLGLAVEDWDPVDSLGWGVMMSWDLSGNWANELLRLRLAGRLPLQRIQQLLPPYPGEPPLETADYPAVYRQLQLAGDLGDATLAALATAAPPSGIEGLGSNNWVVSGSHSASGRPLLANDPHLRLSTPALWYVARLEAPGIHLAGATLPGLPLVVLGQNADIAWGFTNTGPDVQDLYIERVKPGDATQYQTPEGWARFDSHEEVIRIKGRPDQRITVRSSRHGPVISDAGVADDVLGSSGHVLALRWTGLDADAELVTPVLGFARARSVAEFVAASRGWLAPMQNMVVADRAGHIGFVAAGRVPLRRPDNDLHGLVPAPGWDARYDWAGWLPLDATPREFDPPRGFIATANQRIQAPGDTTFLTSEWTAPYRQQRIEALLQATPKHDVASFRAMQADVKSLAAGPLLPWLLKAHSGHPLAAAALRELQGFDGTMAADRAAPLIFQAWARAFTEGVFADELGPALYARVLGGRSLRDALEGVLARGDAWWCDDKSTPQAETCEQQAGAALGRALDELQARFGSDVARWRWGAAHQLHAEHCPFSKLPGLAALFELRAPLGGDTYTINASRVSLLPDAATGERYRVEHGPSLRAIYDLGDLRHSRVMISSGQSGNVFSPWYRSLLQPWGEVKDLPLWPQQPPAHQLLLQPQPQR
jgi:penicillin amidase